MEKNGKSVTESEIFSNYRVSEEQPIVKKDVYRGGINTQDL
jgi:hypothetical protein